MVYVCQPTTGGPVKIGHSADVPARIRQLEAHYGRPLALLATLPGGLEEEQAIHRRFAHLRLGRTEQFRPGADLMAFLGRPLLAAADVTTFEAMGRNPLALVPIVSLVGEPEERQWIEDLADHSGLSVSTMFVVTMAPLAEAKGFR